VKQKRSKHYVRFGRSSPVDIDEYIYDDDEDPGSNSDDKDHVLQSNDGLITASTGVHVLHQQVPCVPVTLGPS